MIHKHLSFILIFLIILTTGCVNNFNEIDITCTNDADCQGSCGCGCINRNESCPGDDVKDCSWNNDCFCNKGFCSSVGASEIIGITDCAKFKTGECQSDAIVQICSGECYWIDNPEIITSIDVGVKVKVVGIIRNETKECNALGARICALDTPFTEYYILIKSVKPLN